MTISLPRRLLSRDREGAVPLANARGSVTRGSVTRAVLSRDREGAVPGSIR